MALSLGRDFSMVSLWAIRDRPRLEISVAPKGRKNTAQGNALGFVDPQGHPP